MTKSKEIRITFYGFSLTQGRWLGTEGSDLLQDATYWSDSTCVSLRDSIVLYLCYDRPLDFTQSTFILPTFLWNSYMASHLYSLGGSSSRIHSRLRLSYRTTSVQCLIDLHPTYTQILKIFRLWLWGILGVKTRILPYERINSGRGRYWRRTIQDIHKFSFQSNFLSMCRLIYNGFQNSSTYLHYKVFVVLYRLIRIIFTG